VTSNEVETAVKTVKDLQDKGKKVKKFYGKLMMLMRFTMPGLRLLPHLGRTLLLGAAIQLGCKGVQEVIIVGGRRRVTVLGGGLSPYSLLYFWESVRATNFLGQVVEAKLKFWAYARMVHLANSLVGGAPGIWV
jgi:hypothetical protein